MSDAPGSPIMALNMQGPALDTRSLPSPLAPAGAPQGEPAHCPNCRTPYPQPLSRHCAHCGQEVGLRVPTLLDFVKEFGGHYLSSDGALWRTLRLLFVPAALTREYMAGRRRRYLLPLRLFLSLVVACVLVGHFTEPTAERVDSWGSAQPGGTYIVSIFNISVGQRAGSFVCEGLPAPRCDQLRQRWERDPQVLQELRRQQSDAMDRQESWLLLAMTPLLAILMAWIYRGRRLPFGYHMVSSLHLSSAWLALVTLHQLAHGTAASTPLGNLLLLLGVLLGTVTLQRLHGGRWWVTGLRMAALCLGYVLLLGVVMGAGLWWATRTSFY